jgi:steroid 5-alpha reductase family enzyme
VWIARAAAVDVDGYPAINARMILSFCCISLWGLRLAWHIARRHTKEDFRYVEFRNNWSTHGTFWLYVQFYLKIFVLQGFFSLIVNSAALYTAIFSLTNTLVVTDYVGAVIWLFGFVFEVVGDY